MKNYYNILGVNENATQDEIKKSYRLLSKQYHPDVNPEGNEKFKEISEAYDVLGNQDKKNNYDNQKNNPFHGFNGGGFDIHSVFNEMMNGGRQTQRKAPDKVIGVDITPNESFFGVKKEFKYEFFNYCNPCNGSGGDRRTCRTCNGQGFIVQKIGNSMFQQIINTQCTTCGGAGNVISNPCSLCSGNGVIKEVDTVSVNVPKNVDNGDFVRLGSKGDFNQVTQNRGDLILKIILNKADGFEKNGKNLIYYKTLTAIELITKSKIQVPHPEGELNIHIPNNLNSDNPLRVVNKGFKYNDGIGDFFIKISVTNNYEINQETKENIKKLLNIID